MGEEYMANITDNFQVEGFVEQKKELEKLMMSNPAMEKKVQGLIRSVLAEVRKKMGEEAQGAMASDPRQAYKAVRSAVYKRILGGNVNILQKRRASGGGTYTPTRTLRTGQRGGNRRLRSERSMKLESYVGSNRGFVLRFLNAGTNERGINFTSDEAREHVHRGSQGGNLQKYGKTINTGRRGAIAPRNFFGNRSHLEMEKAAENLTKLIDNLIQEELR
jgi:hypothetical protein